MASDEDRAEYEEGPVAAQRFEDAMRRVLTVSKAELDKREADYKNSRQTKKGTRTIPAR